MRSRNEAGVVGGKGQQSQSACACLFLVGVEFPRDLRVFELKRRHMHDVAPDQQCFAGTRHAKARVPDFMAGDLRRQDWGPNAADP